MGRKYPAETGGDISEFDTFPSFQCNKLFCTGGVYSHTTVEIFLSGTHLNCYTKALFGKLVSNLIASIMKPT
jgi:hypothetical protein